MVVVCADPEPRELLQTNAPAAIAAIRTIATTIMSRLRPPLAAGHWNVSPDAAAAGATVACWAAAGGTGCSGWPSSVAGGCAGGGGGGGAGVAGAGDSPMYVSYPALAS